MSVTGYLHPKYAAALAEFGEPIELPRSQGWLLRRPIENTPYRDAMGCYPLFTCRNWAELPGDLAALGGEIVSVSLVLDPFGEWILGDIEAYFDRIARFKEHVVVDITASPEKTISKHHRYYARKALRELRVERCQNPVQYVDEWTALYATLIQRHDLDGIKAFSRQSFEKQLAIPGLEMFRILKGNLCVGSHLWLLQGDVAYSHLMAVCDIGYTLNASYGLYSEAIRWFSETPSSGIRWLHLGGGAGTSVDATDGLAQFKQGWGNATRPVYFGGRTLNRARYDALSRERAPAGTAYFPAYRHGELERKPATGLTSTAGGASRKNMLESPGGSEGALNPKRSSGVAKLDHAGLKSPSAPQTTMSAVQEAIAIWGAGGHGRVVAAALDSLHKKVSCFVQSPAGPDTTDLLPQHEILREHDPNNALVALRKRGVCKIALGFGNCRGRHEIGTLALSMGFTLVTVVHPAASISPDAILGAGVFVGAGCIIDPGVRIGEFTIINHMCAICHDTCIGRACHICPGVVLAGGCIVGDLTWLGVASTCRDRIRIGNHVFVGSKANVVRDIPSGSLAYGNPARVVRPSPDNF